MCYVCQPLFLQLTFKFSGRLDTVYSEAMAFRMVEQDNSKYFRIAGRTIGRIILSNIFQTSQQHFCTTAAGMLQMSKVVEKRQRYKRHLINLLRGVKLKKTVTATHEASSEIQVPQYFKPKIKKVCHSVQYFLLIGLSLDICICSHMKLSQVQENLQLERSWNEDNLVV